MPKSKHSPTSPHSQLKRALNASMRDRQRGILRDPYQRPDRRSQPTKPTTLGQLFARKLKMG